MCAGHPVTEEQQERLKRLQAALTVIADHQAALQTALDADVQHHLESVLQLRYWYTLCLQRRARCPACMLCRTSTQALTLHYAQIVPASLQLQAAEAQRRAALRADAPRDPGHVRMEELRALQQAALTPDDIEQRFRAAQAIKPVQPCRVCTCAASPPRRIVMS